MLTIVALQIIFYIKCDDCFDLSVYKISHESPMKNYVHQAESLWKVAHGCHVLFYDPLSQLFLNKTLIHVKVAHFSNVCCHAPHMVITLTILSTQKITMDFEGIGRQVKNSIQMDKDMARWQIL
jgi:hypothetical protein